MGCASRQFSSEVKGSRTLESEKMLAEGQMFQ